MKNRRYFLTLDLKDDRKQIAEYERYHKNVWPEVIDSIKEAGIIEMEIYRWNARLIMMIEVDAVFSFEKKRTLDLDNPKVQEWEELMATFQQELPGNNSNGKWQIMDKIFEL